MATISEDVQQSTARAKKRTTADIGQLSQFELMRRRFVKSKLSVFGAIVLVIMYALALFADFIAPYDPTRIDSSHQYAAPTQIVFRNGGFGIHGVRQELDAVNYQYVYVIDTNTVYPMRLFVQGEPYRLFGFILITIILAFLSWTGLSREVRGKVLAYRNNDYSNAAIAAGASNWHVISKHMIPNALSHIIVVASFAIPGAIAAETALSFLNLGMLPPAISWGVLLQDAQQVQSVLLYPWLLVPLGAIILACLCMYLLGDGLRDAVDPYA
jgi:ABC-type dipeptide/oligopeptide/nickel transport system permease subunit